MPRRDQPEPGDLLRVGVTIAGVALALGALRPDSGATPFLLLGGFLAVAGSGYAMAALWRTAGLSLRDLIPYRRPEGMDERYESLVYISWGLLVTGTAFLAMIFAATG